MSRRFNKEISPDEDFTPRRRENRRPSDRRGGGKGGNSQPKRRKFNSGYEDGSEDSGFERRRSRGKDSGDRGFGRERRRDHGGKSSGRSHFGKPDKDRSFKKSYSEKDQGRPRRRNVIAESEILTEIMDRRKSEGRMLPRKKRVLSLEFEEKHGPVRLNKYIANAGICSRREADVLIASGAITVNGEVVTEMGHKVLPTDEVRYGDRVLQREKPVYVLLNKPKDYITTTDDERDRANVMELVRNACEERIYPVGRLDRDTTGLLLFTNDGDMTKKLTHPSSAIEKTYAVELDKNFASVDMDILRNGIELSDGKITPDDVQYIDESKKHVGITIHSGKNRIIRRIFEALGYEVVKLDRVVFAGLTKKDLPRGHWRFLTKNEVSFLKMLSTKEKKS
ncbi:MAG: pseudouridine synthase [Bacteroidales bacterium]|nr:pseudouridine synthase [Bacteroidales bacterium]MDY6347538.1 pseudouridine synthase [Bacteroidales bacterium]